MMKGSGQRLLLGAAIAGLIHAGFSFYWALGGRWLLATIGQWAVDLGRDYPVIAGLGLGLIGALKAAGALLPLLASQGRVGWPRLWRGLAWPASALLVAYGGANTVAANLVLTGVISPDGGYDRVAMLGHGLLWDPLFLVWGVLLGGGLYATRSAADHR